MAAPPRRLEREAGEVEVRSSRKRRRAVLQLLGEQLLAGKGSAGLVFREFGSRILGRLHFLRRILIEPRLELRLKLLGCCLEALDRLAEPLAELRELAWPEEHSSNAGNHSYFGHTQPEQPHARDLAPGLHGAPHRSGELQSTRGHDRQAGSREQGRGAGGRLCGSGTARRHGASTADGANAGRHHVRRFRQRPLGKLTKVEGGRGRRLCAFRSEVHDHQWNCFLSTVLAR
mmetsp:Transcript_23346/g.64772  ORF Transcript_23346/g.64772 Transcript_23346/m.64772 type:complete len:231 (-) Transcript_23346:43-735(-)